MASSKCCKGFARRRFVATRNSGGAEPAITCPFVYEEPEWDGIDNLNIAGATEVIPGYDSSNNLFPFDLSLASPSGLPQAFQSTPAAANDLFYYFTAIGENMYVEQRQPDIGEEDLDAAFELWDANTGQRIFAVNDESDGGDERIIATGLVKGRRYYARVYAIEVFVSTQGQLAIFTIPRTQLSAADRGGNFIWSDDSGIAETITTNLPVNQFFLQSWEFRFSENEAPFRQFIVSTPDSNPNLNLALFTQGEPGRSYCVQTRPNQYFGPQLGEFADGYTITLEAPPPPPDFGYGLLYNSFAYLDPRGIAPAGFRVPSQGDLQTLAATLSPSEAQALTGDRTPPTHPFWNSGPPGGGQSGFDFYAAGRRVGANGVYQNLSSFGYIASTTVNSPGVSYFITTIATTFVGTSSITQIRDGINVRCVSDVQPAGATVTDADGNEYEWVQIGAQFWLTESLKTTRYNNGDLIESDLDNAQWSSTSNGAWAYPNGDDSLPI